MISDSKKSYLPRIENLILQRRGCRPDSSWEMARFSCAEPCHALPSEEVALEMLRSWQRLSTPVPAPAEPARRETLQPAGQTLLEPCPPAPGSCCFSWCFCLVGVFPGVTAGVILQNAGPASCLATSVRAGPGATSAVPAMAGSSLCLLLEPRPVHHCLPEPLAPCGVLASAVDLCSQLLESKV